MGKKILSRKRYVPTDTMGLLLGVVVHPALVHDRDGAALGATAVPCRQASIQRCRI